MSILSKFKNISRELKLFAIATIAMSIAYSVYDSTFNNYINLRFSLTGFQRSFLEVPREIPGFLVIFVSALLWFLCSRRLGTLAMVLGAVGSILIGFLSPSYGIMVVWLFIYSLGQHVFMPIQSTIGMELSSEGKTGRRLGQINALRNSATILGSFLVFLGFKYLKFTYHTTFIICAVGLLIAAALLYMMKPEKAQQPKTFLRFHPEYKLYYALSVLYGSRKQLFITFAPWVLVTIFKQPTQTMATLLMVGGVIGILFQPLLGWMIDHFGERVVLSGEAILLVLVCFGYGFSRELFPEGLALWVTFGCFLLDQMLMSVSMARSTYMKKIALKPDDIQPALTMGVTIDHVFSISVALIGGLIWNAYGYQYVFLLGVGIAIINFFTAIQVKIPANKETVIEP